MGLLGAVTAILSALSHAVLTYLSNNVSNRIIKPVETFSTNVYNLTLYLIIYSAHSLMQLIIFLIGCFSLAFIYFEFPIPFSSLSEPFSFTQTSSARLTSVTIAIYATELGLLLSFAALSARFLRDNLCVIYTVVSTVYSKLKSWSSALVKAVVHSGKWFFGGTASLLQGGRDLVGDAMSTFVTWWKSLDDEEAPVQPPRYNIYRSFERPELLSKDVHYEGVVNILRRPPKPRPTRKSAYEFSCSISPYPELGFATRRSRQRKESSGSPSRRHRRRTTTRRAPSSSPNSSPSPPPLSRSLKALSSSYRLSRGKTAAVRSPSSSFSPSPTRRPRYKPKQVESTLGSRFGLPRHRLIPSKRRPRDRNAVKFQLADLESSSDSDETVESQTPSEAAGYPPGEMGDLMRKYDEEIAAVWSSFFSEENRVPPKRNRRCLRASDIDPNVSAYHAKVAFNEASAAAETAFIIYEEKRMDIRMQILVREAEAAVECYQTRPARERKMLKRRKERNGARVCFSPTSVIVKYIEAKIPYRQPDSYYALDFYHMLIDTKNFDGRPSYRVDPPPKHFKTMFPKTRSSKY